MAYVRTTKTTRRVSDTAVNWERVDWSKYDAKLIKLYRELPSSVHGTPWCLIAERLGFEGSKARASLVRKRCVKLLPDETNAALERLRDVRATIVQRRRAVNKRPHRDKDPVQGLDDNGDNYEVCNRNVPLKTTLPTLPSLLLPLPVIMNR